jgi:hypothetical protein
MTMAALFQRSTLFPSAAVLDYPSARTMGLRRAIALGARKVRTSEYSLVIHERFLYTRFTAQAVRLRIRQDDPARILVTGQLDVYAGGRRQAGGRPRIEIVNRRPS